MSERDEGCRLSALPAHMVLHSGVTPDRVAQAREGLQVLCELLEDGLYDLATRPPADALSDYEDFLARIEGLAAEAVQVLDDAGWKVELGETKQARPFWGQETMGRPLTAYSFHVGTLFELEATRHRHQTGKPLPEHNSEEVRQRIAKKLELLKYPPERLDTFRKGSIWKALDNYLSYRREAQRKRRSPNRR